MSSANAKGTLYRNEDGWAARITLKGRQRKRFAPGIASEADATKRATLLSKMAQRFRRAGVIDSKQALDLLNVAATCTENMLAGVEQVAGELCGRELVDRAEANAVTFGEVVKEWTDGSLLERFPHQVRGVGDGYLETAAGRLKKACFDAIRDVPEHKTIEVPNRSEGGAEARAGHLADDALNPAHHVTEAQGAVNPTQSGAQNPTSRTRK